MTLYEQAEHSQKSHQGNKKSTLFFKWLIHKYNKNELCPRQYYKILNFTILLWLILSLTKHKKGIKGEKLHEHKFIDYEEKGWSIGKVCLITKK